MLTVKTVVGQKISSNATSASAVAGPERLQTALAAGACSTAVHSDASPLT
jgi:hypothetical protein